MLRVLVMTAAMMLVFVQPTFAFETFVCDFGKAAGVACKGACKSEVEERLTPSQDQIYLLMTKNDDDENWSVKTKNKRANGTFTPAENAKFLSAPSFYYLSSPVDTFVLTINIKDLLRGDFKPSLRSQGNVYFTMSFKDGVGAGVWHCKALTQ